MHAGPVLHKDGAETVLGKLVALIDACCELLGQRSVCACLFAGVSVSTQGVLVASLVEGWPLSEVHVWGCTGCDSVSRNAWAVRDFGALESTTCFVGQQ
jgi:hypothetical protein